MVGELVAAGRRLLPDWSVSVPAQRAGVAVLTDPGREAFAERTRTLVKRERLWLTRALRQLGAGVVDSAANYLLLRLPESAPSGVEIANHLIRKFGIAVRTCEHYAGLDARYLRVAVLRRSDNLRLVEAFATSLRLRSPLRSPESQA
jgi:threonine-phosphate decarboxylase